MTLRTLGSKASVAHTDEGKAKDVQKVYDERISTALYFPNTAQLQRKVRGGFMCQHGPKKESANLFMFFTRKMTS